MRKSILAEIDRDSNLRPYGWLTIGDVAKMLERTPRGARWIVDQAHLPCVRTSSGCRLLRPIDVKVLADERMQARLRGVRAFRPKRLGVRGEPHQLSLFYRPQALVTREGSALPHAEVLRAGSRGK